MVLTLDRWVGKVAIVTGASAGIGAAISEQLVIKGLKVVGLARRKERVDALAKKLAGKRGQLYAVKADISNEGDILKAFRWVRDNLGPVHILVNNAGIAQSTSLRDGDTEKWQKIIDVNVIGLSIATREAVKDMKKNNVDGHIIHINSLAGHEVINFPNLNVYSASKFAVTALAETLRLELNSQKSKIKITNLSPGAVATEIIPEEAREQFNVKQLIEEGKMLHSEDIADSVVYVLSTPPHVQIQELTIRPILDIF